MIELRELSKRFQTQSGWITALDKVSLTVQSGEILGVIGKSGAGKSTLIRMVNMLERPDSGQVLIDGCDLTALKLKALNEERKRIGMIFQHFNLLSMRTVFDNVALPLRLHGTVKRELLEARVSPLLNIVGLKGREDCYPCQLSGGQKQRVAIARALVNQPRVLLCDEATSALDAHTRDEILDLMREINRTLGISIILITHQLDVVKRIAHQVAVLDHGTLLENQKLIDFMLDPRSQIGRKLVVEDLRLELPAALQASLSSTPFPGCHAILQLTFAGDVATQPVVSNFARDHQLTMNILQASLESVQGQLVGAMMISIALDGMNEEGILSGLRRQGIQVAVIGYRHDG